MKRRASGRPEVVVSNRGSQPFRRSCAEPEKRPARTSKSWGRSTPSTSIEGRCVRRAFQAATRSRMDAVITLPNTFFVVHAARCEPSDPPPWLQ